MDVEEDEGVPIILPRSDFGAAYDRLLKLIVASEIASLTYLASMRAFPVCLVGIGMTAARPALNLAIRRTVRHHAELRAVSADPRALLALACGRLLTPADELLDHVHEGADLQTILAEFVSLALSVFYRAGVGREWRLGVVLGESCSAAITFFHPSRGALCERLESHGSGAADALREIVTVFAVVQALVAALVALTHYAPRGARAGARRGRPLRVPQADLEEGEDTSGNVDGSPESLGLPTRRRSRRWTAGTGPTHHSPLHIHPSLIDEPVPPLAPAVVAQLRPTMRKMFDAMLARDLGQSSTSSTTSPSSPPVAIGGGGIGDVGGVDERTIEREVHKLQFAQSVMLSGVTIDGADVVAIEWMLAHCEHLDQFFFDHATIPPAHLRAIARALARRREACGLRPIQHVYLTDCAIGPEAVEHLASAHMGLDQISLGRNPLGDEGARRLARGIREQVKRGQPPALTYVGLSNCGIGLVGAAELGRALAKCERLSRVVFFGNQPGADSKLKVEMYKRVARYDPHREPPQISTNNDLRYVHVPDPRHPVPRMWLAARSDSYQC